jgi:hypothetical protein
MMTGLTMLAVLTLVTVSEIRKISGNSQAQIENPRCELVHTRIALERATN